MIPILIQNVITNFVSLLDNVMVGRLGTAPMSGVAIVNQIIFVFNQCVFGGLAGAGIFTAQYFGKGDSEGVRQTVRTKLYIAAFIIAAGFTIISSFGSSLVSLFIHEGEQNLDLAATHGFAMEYLRVVIWQLPLFALMTVYSGTLRETGETKLPMVAGIIAVFVNLTGNYILIYGKLGAPALGVTGAALATLAARIVECGIVIIYPHANLRRFTYLQGLFSSLRVPGRLFAEIGKKGMPLMINELLWSGGMTTLNQIMSQRGLEAVSAENIASTVSNLFFCAFFATGSTVAIMVGQLLGAGKLEEAVDENRKIAAFSVAVSAAVGIVMLFAAPYIPRVYNTTPAVKSLAASMIVVNAIMMPSNAFTNASFFALRSGGRVWITFLYDSVYIWVLSIPVSLALVKFTSLAIIPIYAISYGLDIVKCISGYILVKKKIWVRNLVSD